MRTAWLILVSLTFFASASSICSPITLLCILYGSFQLQFPLVIPSAFSLLMSFLFCRSPVLRSLLPMLVCSHVRMFPSLSQPRQNKISQTIVTETFHPRGSNDREQRTFQSFRNHEILAAKDKIAQLAGTTRIKKVLLLRAMHMPVHTSEIAQVRKQPKSHKIAKSRPKINSRSQLDTATFGRNQRTPSRSSH